MAGTQGGQRCLAGNGVWARLASPLLTTSLDGRLRPGGNWETITRQPTSQGTKGRGSTPYFDKAVAAIIEDVQR